MSAAAGLSPQIQVLNALVLRETRTRFGQNQLGYLWAFIEPTLWILTFYAMFQFAQREPPLGMSIVGFIVSGLVPFQLFRSIAQRSMNAVDGNKALLFYPQVRPLDLVMARAVLEAATLTVVFAVILVVDSLALGGSPVADPLRILVGLALGAALGGSFGLVLSAISVYTQMIDRLLSPLLRPMFWVSGVFFSADSLPAAAREPLLWNPVLHVVEFVRSGMSTAYSGRYVDLGYVATWILGMTLLGLVLERIARRRLEVT